MKDHGPYRRRYFVSCLNKVFKIPDLESVAIPKKMACNGSSNLWEYSYFKIIQKFAFKYP